MADGTITDHIPTPSQRRAMLDWHQNAKGIWVVILILQGTSCSLLVFVIVTQTLVIGFIQDPGLTFFTGLGAALVVLTAGAIAIFIGMYRLDEWVQWMMWLNAIISFPALISGGSRNLIGGLLPVLVTLGYTYVMRVMYPPAPSTSSPVAR